MKKLASEDSSVRIVSLSRNFGHQIAVKCGLQWARGEAVVVLDGDLQDPPELVEQMFEKWRQGFKVVYGIRKEREEGFVKQHCYNLFYRLMSNLASMEIPCDVGDFCLMDRKVVDPLNMIREHRPYVRGLRAWVGFDHTGVEYSRPARAAGQSKYSYPKLIMLAFDGILSFSNVPLNSATFIGLIISAASLMYGAYVLGHRLLEYAGVLAFQADIPGWASLAVGISFLIGLQFMYLGILGNYLGRIFMQTKQRPEFIVEELVGFDDQVSQAKSLRDHR
jgi:dolichol-phosphate mannosyltransferase